MTIDEFIKNSIHEDIGDGDHTSLACVPEDAIGKAKLLIKEEGVLAGIDLAQQIFYAIDPELQLEISMADGSKVKVGDIPFHVYGKSRSILKAERLVLNCMQRMSGIATVTNRIVEQLVGSNTKVLDTRKTTPGLRFMEKWAVRIGGGENHRFGLYDMIMIKDNHIDYAGGIENAIHAANDYLSENRLQLKIEIETRNLKELAEVLNIGKVDRIMLDNYSFDDLRKAVEMIGGRYETEASGGITEETAKKYADCAVDYISIGALTHSVKSLDISLKAF